MSAETRLIIPITLWSSSSPTHRISCVDITPNAKKLVSCSFDGQLCIWDLDIKTLEITPRLILVGHNDPVTCLVCTDDYAISSSKGGEISLWNLDDGYCLKSLTTPFIHTKFQLFKICQRNEELLFACGYYTEIFVINPSTLQTVCILYSKADSDWISSFQVFSSEEIRTDVVSGLTKSGYLKLWIIDEIYNEVHYEVQSSLLPVEDIIDFKYNANQTQLLIVSMKTWKVFELKNTKSICSTEVCDNERLLGGHFRNSNVLVWTSAGKFYLYTVNEDSPVLNFVFKDESITMTAYEPAMGCTEKYLIHGDFHGCVHVWDIDKVQPMLTGSLKDKWRTQYGLFEDLIDYSNVSTSLYVSQLDRFIIGCGDGTIINIPAIQTIMSYYFHSAIEKPTCQTMLGHEGSVTCLVYPHEKYSHYHESFVVSGGSDHAVCLWDIFKSQLIHKFCVHGGDVIKLLLPPDTCKSRIRNGICSISSDHSVAVLNLKEKRCVFLASRHLFSVISINWKPEDDFIVIECCDGNAYVWQMDTGHLDRVLHGLTAQQAIYACTESQETTCNFEYYDKNTIGKIENNLKLSCDFPMTLHAVMNQKCHVLLFNVEHIVAQINNIMQNGIIPDLTDPIMNQKIFTLTQQHNVDVSNQISDLLEKIKRERIENHEEPCHKSVLTMSRFLLSALHDWNADPALDKYLSENFGLLVPDLPLIFGLASKSGLSLFLKEGKVSSNLTAFRLTAMSALLDSHSLNDTKEISSSTRPSLERLAELWQNKCPSVRNTARKLLTSELMCLTPNEHSNLLELWRDFLPHKQTNYSDLETVALVLFGIIGSDHKFKSNDAKSQESYIQQTCSSLLYLLSSNNDQDGFSELQTIAIDLIGRGYIVWEPFLKIEQIFSHLFELCSDVYKMSNRERLTAVVDKSLTAHATLKSIAIARTNAFISCLMNEISQIKSGQVASIVERSKTEIMLIFNFLLEETPFIMVHHLSEVVSIMAFCIDMSHLKQGSLADLVPGVGKFRQVHHCTTSQRVAIGLASGSIVIHELKANRTLAIASHGDAVTAVKFSPDGRILASYCCFESRLSFWQLGSGMFGLGHLHVKCIKSCNTSPLHDEEIRNHLDIATIIWIDNRSLKLCLCDGSEAVFHL